MRRTWRSCTVLIVTVIAGAGCAAQRPTATSSSPTSAASASTSWVEDAITFPVGDTTVYGTYRHPAGQARPVPGALLIAGSGPTDRNGNSTTIPGPIDTLRNLAQTLSNDGVATLRYDKLGSGQTGLGPYANDPTKLDNAVFQDEATAALKFLAGQSGVDPSHLMILGHSEGALYAMLVAIQEFRAAGTAPQVQALGLLEPQSRRTLDTVSEQLHAKADGAAAAGRLTADQAAQLTSAVDSAIQEFRATGNVPPGEPSVLKPIINAANARALRQLDATDPAAIAATLPRGMPVLVTCSDSDIQVTCQDVDQLVSGLTGAGAKTDYVHLTGVNHVLKEDASKTAADYGKPLPFSAQFSVALASFVKENLTAPGH
jgi:acetyl esterase/lipase